MEHRLVLPGTTGPEVVVRTGFIGFPEVTVAGARVERESVSGRPAWRIPLADGTSKLLFIRGGMTGLQGSVDGERIRIERPLAWWELVLCLAPFCLVAFGAVGGLVGLVASVVNLRLVRRQSSVLGRVGVLVTSFVVSLAIAFAVALAVLGAASALPA